jgi:hypothetical protein
MVFLMPLKTDKLNIRLTPEIKNVLRKIAAREHRTISNMIEAMILEKSKKHGISVRRSEKQSNNTPVSRKE